MKKSQMVLIILLTLVGLTEMNAQQSYTISVPTQQHAAAPQGVVPNYGILLNAIFANLDLYLSTQCLEKINSEIEDKIYRERKKLDEKQPYVLAVNYETCQIEGLVKNVGEHLWSGESVLHFIDLYPIIRINGREF